MANINQVNTDYIKRWEGDLSRDPSDPAASNPVPDGSGNHTKRGVTWSTFVGLAPKIGYNPTPALFYQMPQNIWLKIYKIGYWDPMRGDQIKSQAVAELLADFAWGSGPGTATYVLQRYLGINPDGNFGPVTLVTLNNKITTRGQKTVFQEIFTARLNFLKTLANWPIYGVGWLNRLNDFYDYANKLASKNAGVIIFALIGTGVAIYNWDKIVKLFA